LAKLSYTHTIAIIVPILSSLFYPIMKLKLLGLLMLSVLGLHAAETPVKSTISAVMFFLEGAQVTRAATLSLRPRENKTLQLRYTLEYLKNRKVTVY
jgi:hypothetical protein